MNSRFEILVSNKLILHYSLSEHEHKILSRKAWGFSNQKTSEELSINERMVMRHLSNILQKLHLVGRVKAAVDSSQENSILNSSSFPRKKIGLF